MLTLAGLAALAGIMGAALVGCSSPTSTDAAAAIEGAAESDPTGFVIPQNIAPAGEWEQLAVVCPYTAVADLPRPFQHCGRGHAAR